MTRGGGPARAIGACLLTVILGLLIGVAPAAAREPDGAIDFGPVWVETDRSARDAALRGPGGAELRLDLAAYVDLPGAVVEVRAPPGIRVDLPGPADGAAGDLRVEPDGTSVWTLPIGDLVRAAPRSLRFRCRVEDGTGAVVTFAVESIAEGGRLVRDAVGIPVGHPGADPRRRHDAIEFRSVPAPDADVPEGAGGGRR